jgi:hypothetical protein
MFEQRRNNYIRYCPFRHGGWRSRPGISSKSILSVQYMVFISQNSETLVIRICFPLDTAIQSLIASLHRKSNSTSSMTLILVSPHGTKRVVTHANQCEVAHAPPFHPLGYRELFLQNIVIVHVHVRCHLLHPVWASTCY